jgi:hypothetical protein
VTTILSLGAYGNKQASEWKCVDIGKGFNVVGRLNRGEAECMYDPQNIGCFMLKSKKTYDGKLDQKDLDIQCKNLIDNYPKITVDGTKYVMNAYTCGKGSKNEELWKTTGYESPKDTCYKILQDRSIFKEVQNLLFHRSSLTH